MDLNQSLDKLMEETGKFKRLAVTPHETMLLAGRGLAVTGEVLDAVSKDFAQAKPATRVISRVGKIIIGVARILTPGGVEGSLYRQWAALLLLIGGVLLAMSLFVSAYRPAALAVLGYTAVAIVVVEAARIVAFHPKPWAKLVWSAVSLIALFGAACYAANWLGGLWERTDCPSKDQPCVEPAKHFLAPWDDPQKVMAAGLVLTILTFVGLVWSQIVSRSEFARGKEPVLKGVAVAVFGTVLPFAAAAALSLGYGYLAKTYEGPVWLAAAYGPIVLLLLLCLYFPLSSYLAEKKRRRPEKPEMT